MSRGIFITGTDTDVGKTIITAGLLRYLLGQGIDAVSMKPVQTGAETEHGEFVAPDLNVHLAASGLAPTADELALMAPYLYEPACSPHLAGRLAKRYPDPDRIVECYEALAAAHDVVLVEGAGGIYAPITEDSTMLDLMKQLDLPVVLVAHRGLGTINHSLLSLQALRSAGLTVMGIVFNEMTQAENDFIRQDNPDSVASFGKVEVLGNVDYLKALDTDPDAAWALFQTQCVGLRAVADGL